MVRHHVPLLLAIGLSPGHWTARMVPIRQSTLSGEILLLERDTYNEALLRPSRLSKRMTLLTSCNDARRHRNLPDEISPVSSRWIPPASPRRGCKTNIPWTCPE